MVLLRGADIRFELYYSSAWHDLSLCVTSATWQWGATEALGPLTECEGGTLRVSIADPNRDYDPENPASPLLGKLKVGIGFRVLIDSTPAWTGVLQTWGWDRGSGVADLNGIDPLGQLAVRMLPDRYDLQDYAATSAEQAMFLLDSVEWPSANRYFPSGTTGVTRGNQTVEGSALDGLHKIRFSELGRLFPMRDGRIGWWARTRPTPPASSAIINCPPGIPLTDIWKAFGLGRVRNRVVVAAGYGVYGTVRPPDEYRSVMTTPFELSLAGTSSDPPVPLPEDVWAQTILDALDPPPVLTVLGTILPTGTDVKLLLCAEFGARWTAHTTDGDVLVELVGQRVTIAPGVLELDAITEDVQVNPPNHLHAVLVSGSSTLHSESTVSYADARSAGGLGGTVAVMSNYQAYIGQVYTGTWHVYESFLAFDTSSIPAGATILSATFGAMVHPDWPWSDPATNWLDYDLQVRSYPTGGWRPTLAAADWIVGAGSTTLRATFNTKRAIDTGHGGFYEWSDAGSGLIGAVKKGGTTELYVVSARTVNNQAPAYTPYENAWLDFVRLRIDWR